MDLLPPEQVKMLSAQEQAVHFVRVFQAGWQATDPEVFLNTFSRFMHPEVSLTQPMMPKAKGVAAFRREYGRLKQLVPDLRGKVLNWSNQGRGLLWIELSLQGHLKGVPIAWQTVDKIQLNTEGLCISRQAYFDPLPLLMICLKNKVTWGPLLRSGLVWGMLKSLKAESIPSSEGCSAKY